MTCASSVTDVRTEEFNHFVELRLVSACPKHTRCFGTTGANNSCLLYEATMACL